MARINRSCCLLSLVLALLTAFLSACGESPAPTGLQQSTTVVQGSPVQAMGTLEPRVQTATAPAVQAGPTTALTASPSSLDTAVTTATSTSANIAGEPSTPELTTTSAIPTSGESGNGFVLHSSDPVLPAGPQEAWDSGLVDPGAVILHGGVYHMFYNGIRKWPAPLSVGYATSPDGLRWTRATPEPLLTTSGVLC